MTSGADVYAQYELPPDVTERDYPAYYCEMTLAEFYAALARRDAQLAH